MKLTQEQTEHIIQRINNLSSQGSVRKCSFCGHNSWTIDDKIFEIREFQEGNLVVGGDAVLIPVICLCCNSCGNTVFLNAIKWGVVGNQPNKDINDSQQGLDNKVTQ